MAYIFSSLITENSIQIFIICRLTLSDRQMWLLSCRWQSWAWPWEQSAVFCTSSLPCCSSTSQAYWRHEAAWSVDLQPADEDTAALKCVCVLLKMVLINRLCSSVPGAFTQEKLLKYFHKIMYRIFLCTCGFSCFFSHHITNCVNSVNTLTNFMSLIVFRTGTVTYLL